MRNRGLKSPRKQSIRGSQALINAIQELESRRLLSAAPVISEFLANNSTSIVDGNGVHSDWIEIHNQGDASIDLAGWHLTDDPSKPAKWTFPSHVLDAGAYMIVFADSTDTTDPAGNLHTNFALSTAGENLSLRQPDGTVVSEYGGSGALYPKQFSDMSYGSTGITSTTTLLAKGAPGKAFVPIDGSLDAGQWTAINYVDSSWKSGTTAVGFDGGGTASTANLLAQWSAQSLNTLTDGAQVGNWPAAVGTGTATQSTSNKRPTIKKNQINGRSLVHFDGSNDQLKITNQSLNGATGFTVAMLFRTSAVGLSGTNWYNNTGIVDDEVGGVTNDWGLAIDNMGRIGAGVGNPDKTLYSTPGLNDGQAHVVVFTKSGTTTAISIDGGAPVYGTAPAGARTITSFTFGSLNTDINYFNGDIGEVRLYNAALTDDAARSLSNEMSATWGLTPAAGVYTPQIGLDLKNEMAGTRTTADIRIPFTVGSASLFDSLTLNMKYDDGFVAYINGVEVARRNAPAGALTFTSTATSARSDASALAYESIDISAAISALQFNGATNILAIKALNSALTDSDLLISPELIGSRTLASGPAYMTTPTPGAANAPGYAGLVPTVTFSVDHGYHTSAFNTTLTSSSVGSTLVYTTDGSDPSLSNGTVVPPSGSGLPTTRTINVTSSTVIRAVAFQDTYLPSEVAAESYFFAADIVQQPEGTPAGAYWDVGMDTDVVNANQTFSVIQALTAVPTISLSLPDADMFGAGGIYTNPNERGDAWERAVSVEYFDPANPANEFSINAGIRVEGGVSRETSRPKKSFKLYFRSEYGASELDYPVFGAAEAEQVFDNLVLRGGHNYSWANLGGAPLTRAEYLRDEFARDTQLAISGEASRGSFVQLYINGQYWGLYNMAEEINPDFAAAHYGGSAEDYDIIKPDNNGSVLVDDGTIDAWDKLFGDADAAYADGTIDSVEYANISSQVDVKKLADYMLGIFYRGDNDSPVLIGSTTSPRNFIAFHNHTDPNGKFIFETWDGELSLDDIGTDRTEVFGNENPGRLYQQLRTNVDFRQLVVDEINRTFSNNGPLTAAANQARYQSLMNQINVAIVGESARWGNAKQTYVATRDVDWLNETNWIVNTYMPVRSTAVLNQLKSDFPELNTLPPGVFVNGVATTGGTVSSGSTLALSNPNTSPAGIIYYTLDGSDPRSPGGAVSASALTYTSALTITQARHLLTRVLRNGVWSPVQDFNFTVTPPSLRLSEMMYHPPAPAAGAPYAQDEYEFIELVNTGTTSINLGGLQFNAGITGTIPAGTTLAAGARGVVVRNLAAFQYAYGTSAQILGVYTDKLSDAGEEVRLYDPVTAQAVIDFTYQDSWYPSTDGSGYAMVVKDTSANQSVASVLSAASAWQVSTTVGGSPGLAVATSSIAGRRIFYNNSYYDGNSPAFAATDDAAIAADKIALLPGQNATFANYSSYSKGINGIMVDLAGLNVEQTWALTAADLSFRVSVGQTPTWTNAPAGATIAIRRAAGAGSSDRLSISWPDNTIVGKWLEVTVAANARTGLTTPDVFYFGNAPGESGNSANDAIVNSIDELAAHNNPRTFFNRAPATFAYDYNRDGLVNATDELIARNNATTPSTALPLLHAPSPAPAIGRARFAGTAPVSGSAPFPTVLPPPTAQARSTLFPTTPSSLFSGERVGILD